MAIQNRMYEDVTSLEDIIKPEKYPQIKNEIDGFLRKIIKKNIGKIDTIISIDRKGTWILHDFFHDNPDLAKFNFISDNQIFSRPVKGLRILLFDNSVRSGSTLLRTIREINKFHTQNIKIACLLINDKAIKNIRKKQKRIKIEPCKRFSTYFQQSQEYINWEIIYLSGLRIKDNPDYPILKLSTPYDNLDKIYDYIIDSFKKIVNIYDDFIVDSIADTRNSLDISIEINSNDKSIIHPYDSIISEIDGYKIRCFIASYDGNTEIKIIPLLNPRYDSNKCQIWKNSPNDCLYRILNVERTNLICKICVPINLNYNLLINIQTNAIPEIRRKGIIIDNIELRAPELRRFARI
jgi:hypoxanthine phosphoribosyltransferase